MTRAMRKTKPVEGEKEKRRKGAGKIVAGRFGSVLGREERFKSDLSSA